MSEKGKLNVKKGKIKTEREYSFIVEGKEYRCLEAKKLQYSGSGSATETGSVFGLWAIWIYSINFLKLLTNTASNIAPASTLMTYRSRIKLERRTTVM